MAKKEKKTEAKKVESAPEKTPVTEATATAKTVRITPRKVRLVIDLVRGKAVNEALGILANVNRSASSQVAKVITSAATNNFEMEADKLYIAAIYANEGARLKRFMPRAKGSASGLVKRTCHITAVVKERE